MASKSRKAKPDLLELALETIAETGWARFSLSGLARRAELPLAEVHAELPSRGHVLRALARRLDEAMLAIDPAELAELEPRERVFELIMRRLDGAQPYRDGLRAVARSGAFAPELLLASLCRLDRTAAWLLDASGVELGPCRARAARRVLMAVYARVFAVWLRDDTPDRARTLAELDKRLQQAEQLARLVSPRRRRADGTAASGAT